MCAHYVVYVGKAPAEGHRSSTPRHRLKPDQQTRPPSGISSVHAAVDPQATGQSGPTQQQQPAQTDQQTTQKQPQQQAQQQQGKPVLYAVMTPLDLP